MDAVLDYEAHGRATYEAARPPKWLITIPGGTHAGISGTASTAASAFDNADLVSCTTIEMNPHIDAESLAALAESAGGQTAAEVLATCPGPCSGDGPLPKALSPVEQVNVIEQALVAFVLGTLGEDPRALAWLGEVPPELVEGVAVERE
jgi:hypothetical protein